jgi:hypothetical protein
MSRQATDARLTPFDDRQASSATVKTRRAGDARVQEQCRSERTGLRNRRQVADEPLGRTPCRDPASFDYDSMTTDKCQIDYFWSGLMVVRPRAHLLAWSNPVARWWGLLTLVSLVNIALWVALYRNLHEPQAGTIGGSYGIELMLALCAAYVFGCAFRSLLPRADVQRICLFDTWLSSVMVGRTVATVAEVCFAIQWAIILHRLGTMTGADTTLNAALVIVPLILIAEVFSWYAVLTKKYWANALENSIWAIAFFFVGLGLFRLLPEFDGAVRAVLVVTIVGIAGYLAFLATVDVPMYLKRWRAEIANGSKPLRPMEGLRDVSVRWVVTRDISEWKEEIPWMSLYFSAAVWASLALCVVLSLESHLPRYRTDASTNWFSSAPVAHDASAVRGSRPERKRGSD